MESFVATFSMSGRKPVARAFCASSTTSFRTEIARAYLPCDGCGCSARRLGELVQDELLRAGNVVLLHHRLDGVLLGLRENDARLGELPGCLARIGEGFRQQVAGALHVARLGGEVRHHHEGLLEVLRYDLAEPEQGCRRRRDVLVIERGADVPLDVVGPLRDLFARDLSGQAQLRDGTVNRRDRRLQLGEVVQAGLDARPR